jgi:hypothetical protein
MAHVFKYSAAHPCQRTYGEEVTISFDEFAHAPVPHMNGEFGLDVVRNGHYKIMGAEIVFLTTPDQA